jgi:hypothetical protein
MVLLYDFDHRLRNAGVRFSINVFQLIDFELSRSARRRFCKTSSFYDAHL